MISFGFHFQDNKRGQLSFQLHRHFFEQRLLKLVNMWLNSSKMCSSHQHCGHVFSACQVDQKHNPTLSETGLSQSYQSSHVPGVVGWSTNGGFHARVSAGRKQFARHEWAQKAAYLLGCTLEELSSSIFKHQAKGTLPRASAIRQASDENGTADAGTPQTTFTNALFPLHSSQAPSLCHSHCVSHTCAHMYGSALPSPEGNCMLWRK